MINMHLKKKILLLSTLLILISILGTVYATNYHDITNNQNLLNNTNEDKLG